VTSQHEDEFHGFRRDLVANRLLHQSQSAGLYAWTHTFEYIASQVSRAFGAHVAPMSTTTVRFPPTVPRLVVDRSRYATTFPHLVGFVESTPGLSEADGEATIALPGAACHPVFALLAESVVSDELEVWAEGYVFRREPSSDPMRMMSFRQTEVIRLGSKEVVAESVGSALARCRRMLKQWGIDTSEDTATDSFAGRLATLRHQLQRDAGSKRELSFSMWSERGEYSGTALASANLHGMRFGEDFDIRRQDGSAVVSGCVGLGLERTVLALLRTHGADLAYWPQALIEDFALVGIEDREGTANVRATNHES